MKWHWFLKFLLLYPACLSLPLLPSPPLPLCIGIGRSSGPIVIPSMDGNEPPTKALFTIFHLCTDGDDSVNLGVILGDEQETAMKTKVMMGGERAAYNEGRCRRKKNTDERER